MKKYNYHLLLRISYIIFLTSGLAKKFSKSYLFSRSVKLVSKNTVFGLNFYSLYFNFGNNVLDFLFSNNSCTDCENRFSKFVKFWKAIEAKDFKTAGLEMEQSRWWGQVKSRGPELQQLLLDI